MEPKLILIAFAYLLGSVPMGIIFSRLLGGVDPRSSGSKNIGATNVSRSAGRLAGALTLTGDILKGALPVYLALKIDPEPVYVSLAGLAAFLGHIFPIYLGFKGGKGVATGLGVISVISPTAAFLSALVFIIIAFAKRYVSLASMVSAALLPVFLSFLPKGRPYMPAGIVISVFIIIKHRENIKRLISGTENRIGGKK